MTHDTKVPNPVNDQFAARRRAGNEPARHQEGGLSGPEEKKSAAQNAFRSDGANHAVHNSAHGARRGVKFRQAEVARALKAAQKAKVPIACVKIEPDGSILLIPGQPPTVPSSPSPNPWDGEP
jgi:hypothetical protein